MVRRIAPALLLFVLSPLIAEYLSGSMAMTQIGALPVLALMYGGGAVLVRETARRAGRGFASIVLMGLAYGLLEEGIWDQTLFNPHFHGLHLLAYGFMPALGIAAPWTLYVLTIHIVWSIGVPIALVESLFGARRTQPWLGVPGLAVSAVLYAAGAVAVLSFTTKSEHFMASPVQMGAAALAAVACIVAAFLLPRRPETVDGTARGAWMIGLVALCAGSAFVLLYVQGADVRHWPWQAVAAGMIALQVAMIAFGFAVARRGGWSDARRLAMAGGALLVYCWSGFGAEKDLHPGSTPLPHAILAGVMVVLLAVAAARTRRTA